MARIARVTINWTGFVGGPGYTNLHFAPAAGPDITQGVVNAAIAKVDVWLNQWMARIPLAVTLGVDPTVEELDDTNGTLMAFWTGTPEAAAAAGGTGNYSAVSGACVNWYTAGIRNGRRVRGRSFMVPLATGAHGPDGTLDAGTLTSVRTATTTLIANVDAAKLAVWSRPTLAAPTSGISYDVNAFTINDKAAVLTSRRD